MVFSALTIAGSDSGGGAGVQADLKTFAAHRVHGLSIITSLTAQNTSEVKSIHNTPLSFIEGQFDAVHKDFQIGAAKTGMLSSKEIITSVVKKLKDYPLVVDPVMVSESEGRLLEIDAVETLKEKLIPKATIVTPNLSEAEILAEMEIKHQDDMKKACKRIARFGCDVVVKGGHLNATDVLYVDRNFHNLSAEKLEGGFHGSGCTYSSAITANLAIGFDLVESVFNAKAFMKGALNSAFSPGRGEINVVNQMRVDYEAASDDVLRAVRRAEHELEAMEGLHTLVAEVGMNVCYAMKEAKSLGEIAGVSGRIVREKNRVRSTGSVEYGVSRHMGKVVLAAMSNDRDQRAATNLKYKPDTIESIEEMGGFVISSFDREEEPKNTSTMEWGTGEAIKKLGRVPDIIYDRGGVGKEPMIRILARDPSELVAKLRIIIRGVNGL